MSEGEIGWRILNWVWERKDQIGKSLSDLYMWYRGKGKYKNKPGILILGPGGTGKTTLARLLCGEYNLLLDLPEAYDESLGIEHYSLKGKPAAEIVVPPGQLHRRDPTWPELYAELASDKFCGVINLVAYGYHTLGQISYKDHNLYQGNKSKFLQACLADCREDEQNVLQQLLPHLQVAPGRLWLLTVVTKQDLWWPIRSEVESYYKAGKYGSALQQLTGKQTSPRFRHELVFASLVISNFKTGQTERLKPNAEGYDHPIQVESLRRLMETIGALKDWEADK